MSKITPEVLALAESLRTFVGADDSRDFSHIMEFWAREEQRKLEPPSNLSPDEYQGQERLSIACTQTMLSSAKQRRLVEMWCAELPKFTEVKWLYLNSRTSQEIFEAACKLPKLEALRIAWSGITDLSPIAQCLHLRYLKIGSSASVKSIEPLKSLTHLSWLQLDNIKSTTNLNPLSTLQNLEALGFTGAESKNFTVESFDPLANLTELRWLNLGAVHTIDNSLRALACLKNLQFLGLGNFFPMEEFAYLSLHLKSSVCEWAQPFSRLHPTVFPCKNCRTNWRVMTSGKGSRLLCPTCDSVKLAMQILKFNAAKFAAQSHER